MKLNLALTMTMTHSDEVSTWCCQENCHASLRRAIFVVSKRGITKSKYSQWYCEWPELKFHWL